MSPAHTYVRDKDQASTNLGTVPQPTIFKDYLAMYQSATDPEEAARRAQALLPADFDGANSRSYALAWIYTSADASL
jgi:hypothetical protein